MEKELSIVCACVCVCVEQIFEVFCLSLFTSDLGLRSVYMGRKNILKKNPLRCDTPPALRHSATREQLYSTMRFYYVFGMLYALQSADCCGNAHVVSVPHHASKPKLKPTISRTLIHLASSLACCYACSPDVDYGMYVWLCRVDVLLSLVVPAHLYTFRFSRVRPLLPLPLSFTNSLTHNVDRIELCLCCSCDLFSTSCCGQLCF